jgi:hypothetical protein
MKIVYKVGIQNKIIDTLSKKKTLLITWRREISGFKFLIDLYKHDEDFSDS